MADNVVEETLARRINIEQFSKPQLLKSTTAQVLKLYQKYSVEHNPKAEPYTSETTTKDRERAERLWIEDAQKLKNDVNAGKYAKLCPRYKDGIIVVGGRAERWIEATWKRQRFILLPADHQLAYLIILYEPQKNGHLGFAATISRVRAQYWILNIKKLAKRTVSSCLKCKIKLKQLTGQVMGQLPIERMEPSSHFWTVGVDFFGPYTISREVQKRIRGKCFGVIIVCFVSRAVYVDISHDYSTDAFLRVLKRFATLRRWPRKIWSDNGSQLVAASKELCNAAKDLNQKEIERYGVKHGLEWEFSPADAPWYKGATESLVKPVKRALNAATGEEVMSLRELQTVKFEAAQIVN